jgi:signal transduction histidine kinase
MSSGDPDNALLLDSAERSRRRELSRAARILHDSVGQNLTAVGLQLDLLALDFPQLSGAISELRPKLEEAFSSVRGLAYDLNPDIVARTGLDGALEALARRCRCDYARNAIGALTNAQAAAFYRIAECALDNALSHAAGARVEMAVTAGPPASLTVRDHGPGFDPAAVSEGFGLRMIRHLARVNQLKLMVHSAPGQGTMIEILSTLE